MADSENDALSGSEDGTDNSKLCKGDGSGKCGNASSIDGQGLS